jgi:hypothetical protein
MFQPEALGVHLPQHGPKGLDRNLQYEIPFGEGHVDGVLVVLILRCGRDAGALK